jgi:hypothetical protein
MCWIETVRRKRQIPLRETTKRGAVSVAFDAKREARCLPSRPMSP